jgi:Glycosyl transferase family 2
MHMVAKVDPRIRYFRQSQNIGALANFEFVLSKATGKYFSWATDDDLCERSFVEDIIKHMEQDSNIVLCSCDVKIIDDRDNLIRIYHLDSIRPTNDWRQTRSLFFRFLPSNISLCIYGIYQTHCLRMCDLQIMKGWKGYFGYGEVPIVAQVSSFGKIVAIPKVNKIYREHPKSIHNDEIRSITRIDYFMLRLVVRAKLCKLALSDKTDFSTRFTLLSAVMNSLLSSFSVRYFIAQLLPRKLKNYLKETMHL